MSTAPELPKQYDPKAAQETWYPFWVERGYFHADPAREGPAYCVVIPPPNVTGALHLGHALNNTLQDILIRWRRMQGYRTLWMPGTDHAGIATQAVVERRLLETQKKTRHDLGREELVKRIWAWKDQYEARILNQLRQMGCSCDWERTRFTLDETCARAVRETFFRLFKAGKIVRGKRLVNWDTQLRTAVADDEIYTEDVPGHIWTIRYPVVGSDDILHVATTRPETMLGDTAVAVHPDDPRYKHLIGRLVSLPLTDRQIPLIADGELVDPAFGTGCVKVTPAHDPNDYQAGLRNSLPMINLLNPDGTYNEQAPERYRGLDRLVVRKRVLEDLKEQGLLERVDSHLVPLKHSDRSKSPIEPYLSDQWFVRMGDESDGSAGFARQAMEAVTSGRVRIHPERYAKTYLDWLAEKRDWCISRQLWWGHRIPIWYCESCSESDIRRAFAGRADVTWQQAESGGWLICGLQDLTPDALGPGHELVQDPDVLDTWFSSALWPHSTLGWPEQTPELRAFYPTSVLSTARDIITLWVARMVIFGLFNCDDVPFRDVFIHPVIQDGEGKRMSKSAGNGIDPIDIIESFGADALRYTLAAAATETQDLRMPVDQVRSAEGKLGVRTAPGEPTSWVSPEQNKAIARDQRVNTSKRFEEGRTFPNKFWNAARFALMNLEDYAPLEFAGATPSIDSLEDAWILSRLRRVTEQGTQALERFQFAEYTKMLRDFTWGDFCDWYLELIKGRLRQEGRRENAQQVLVMALDGLCRLLHPIMPFVTEQVWQALGQFAPRRPNPGTSWVEAAAESVCVAAWPAYPSAWDWPDAEATIAQWQEKITALRNLRAECNVPASARIRPVLIASGDVGRSLQMGLDQIRSLAGADDVQIAAAADRPGACAVTVLSDCEVILPLEGLIDLAAERARQLKKQADIEKQMAGLQKRLDDPKFVSKAPPEVVAEQHQKLDELKAQHAAVGAVLQMLAASA